MAKKIFTTAGLLFIVILCYRVAQAHYPPQHIEYCLALALVGAGYLLSLLPAWLVRANSAGKTVLLFMAGFFIRLLLTVAGTVILSAKIVKNMRPFLFWVLLLYVVFLVPETFYFAKKISGLSFKPLSPFEKDDNDILIDDSKPA
ncbi:MAG: hypothetical protein AB7F23_02955 [Phycisphaerae bacterium]